MPWRDYIFQSRKGINSLRQFALPGLAWCVICVSLFQWTDSLTYHLPGVTQLAVQGWDNQGPAASTALAARKSESATR